MNRFAIENLESRQLMSVSLAMLPAVQDGGAHGHVGAVLNAPASHTAPAATKLALAKLNVNALQLFVPAGEPAVDSNVTGWVNVSNNALFANGGPSPLDVKQGNVGDCYFLATLAEVAYKDPSRISHLIYQRADKTYDVYFWNGSSWTDEHVDGYLPKTSSGALEYAKLGQSNDTWVAIMEKAFTMFRHPNQAAAYASINSGWPSEALKDLGSGTPTDYYLPGFYGSGYSLATRVNNDLNAGRAVEVSTKSISGPLISLHVYSVMGTYFSGNTAYLLVRNPWGTTGPNANGYEWVNATTLLPQLSAVTMAAV